MFKFVKYTLIALALVFVVSQSAVLSSAGVHSGNGTLIATGIASLLVYILIIRNHYKQK